MTTESSQGEHPATPTLDKIMAVQEDSQVIQGFIEWVFAEKIFFAKYPLLREMYPDEGKYDESDDTSVIAYPVTINLDNLLHQYFGVDPVEEGKERTAILEYVQEHTLNPSEPSENEEEPG